MYKLTHVTKNGEKNTKIIGNIYIEMNVVVECCVWWLPL